MKWQAFEKHVRTVASYKWDTPATAETINGVKVDCVLKPKHNYWILVEITQEKSLSKLRTDLAKFATVRPFLMSQDVYAECFFVSESGYPSSLRDSGKGQSVSVLTLSEFDTLFFDFESYCHIGTHRKFHTYVDTTS